MMLLKGSAIEKIIVSREVSSGVKFLRNATHYAMLMTLRGHSVVIFSISSSAAL